ncbi:MAG: hydrogenase nickel incorporation protein HypB [Firmicutes bacterium]|nr:hydrogenase nickel incorporation protein HypB [Bacillota bacterium]
MEIYKVLEIKKSVYENNDREADLLRQELKKEQTFLLNLMSSPGSGKTTTLLRTIEALKDELRIAILEADIDSDVDAHAVAKTGTRVIQLHTGGMCHLDAGMTRQGLEGIGTDQTDLVVLENVGNLVCPAEFDTGASKNAMILSVPEGDDKPLKYPLMFSLVDVLLINKIDVKEHFDFDLAVLRERVKKLNPNLVVIPISAKTGEGIGEWADWLRGAVKSWNQPE